MIHHEFTQAASHITADNVRDLLTDLVDIPSTTGKEIGVAHYLVERMRKSGMATDLPMVDQGRPNAVGHLRGRGDGLNHPRSSQRDADLRPSAVRRRLGARPGLRVPRLAGIELRDRARL